MNISKRVLIVSTMILNAIQLAACGIATPALTATATTLPSPTLPLVPTSIIQPTTSLSTLTPVPLSAPPDGLRMAYVVDGNLYYQDGGNPSLQLTNNGEDQYPLSFSDDGKKIFFTRGGLPPNIYSINIDGSQEEALVINDLLLTLDTNFDTSTRPCDPVLIPHSSFLLFTTCYRPDPQQLDTIFNSDLFILNTDIHKPKRLLPKGQGGRFYISPDGTMIAIDRQNAIDILDIDGKLIHRKIATYPHSEPYAVGAKMYWLPDSSELILALPINTFYDTSQPPTYAVWRYSPDTNTAIQVNLDPPLMSNETNLISPDGHWIIYFNHDEGLFLGDLREGHTQAIPMLGYPSEWSPDNVHFVYEGPQMYLASVNASPVFMGQGELVGWLDASKYLYYNYSTSTFFLGEIGKESVPIFVGNPPPLLPTHTASFIFNYQKP